MEVEFESIDRIGKSSLPFVGDTVWLTRSFEQRKGRRGQARVSGKKMLQKMKKRRSSFRSVC